MVAAFWRHGSLAALAATLLTAQHAAAEPKLRTTAKQSEPTHSGGTAQLSPRGTVQLNPELSPRGTVQLNPELSPQATVQLSPELSPQATVQLSPQWIAQLSPQRIAQFSLQATPRVTLQRVGGVFERVPTASWAMGCAAGIALAMHAVYQNSSDRHRVRMQSCADDCPNYRIDHYKETRERADVALRLSVFAAASALWLVYNDPQEALERMGQRKLPREQRGFRVKVKPERRGVWASVVAYF